jgi:hypothetical protein
MHIASSSLLNQVVFLVMPNTIASDMPRSVATQVSRYQQLPCV